MEVHFKIAVGFLEVAKKLPETKTGIFSHFSLDLELFCEGRMAQKASEKKDGVDRFFFRLGFQKM